MNTGLSDFTCQPAAAVWSTPIQSILMGDMMTHMRDDGCGRKVTVRQGRVFEGRLLTVQCDEHSVKRAEPG